MYVNLSNNAQGKRPNIWMKIRILEDRIKDLHSEIRDCSKMKDLYYENRQYDAYEREVKEIERLGLLVYENNEVLTNLKIASASLN